MLWPDCDLTNRYDVEGLRRSVAMLTPRRPCLNREEALRVLDAILALSANRPRG